MPKRRGGNGDLHIWVVICLCGIVCEQAVASSLVRKELDYGKRDIAISASGGAAQTHLTQVLKSTTATTTGSDTCVCSESGDPHVLTFDAMRFGGGRWHPMHAPGEWWLVRTPDNSVSIQAKYNGCGDKDGGGWQGARKEGIPRTCINAIAAGGSFMGTDVLIIKPPCEWDWGNSVCTNTDTIPRITLNGQPYQAAANQNIVVTTNGNSIVAKLPQDIEIHMNLWGRPKGVPVTAMNVRIFMKARGKQSGHCGNFNKDKNDDMIYEQTGELKSASADALGEEKDFNDPQVKCADRFMEGGWGCKANPPGTAFSLSDCPAEIRAKAEFSCKEAFKKTLDPAEADQVLEQQELEDCALDECLTGASAQDAADDAVQEEKDLHAAAATTTTTTTTFPDTPSTCSGTMLDCPADVNTDPCSAGGSCKLVYHNCPYKGGGLRSCVAAGTACATSEAGCHTRCEGSFVDEYFHPKLKVTIKTPKCNDLDLNACLETYVAQANTINKQHGKFVGAYLGTTCRLLKFTNGTEICTTKGTCALQDPPASLGPPGRTESND